ncbi:MAG: HNH endonuclease [Chitinophagaceae bacterium]
MNIDYDEILKGQKVLIDPHIHRKASLTRAEFIERVKCVEHLRTAYNPDYISFYITSVDEYNNLIKFHDLVNNGVFDFESHHVFAIAICPKLYDWFKTTSILTIQKQITAWLAGCYFFNPRKRTILRNQIYKPLFEEILLVVDNFYSDFKFNDIEVLIEEDCDNEIFFSERERCKNQYLVTFSAYCETKPPEFLQSPFENRNFKDWGIKNFCFEFVQGYFSESDWDRIVIKGNTIDTLHRAESSDYLWIKWRHVYMTFDKSKGFVYNYYIELSDKGYNSQKSRESITKNIKNDVWKRDEGKCVRCGSNVNLEFDHIIPFSKGGSSTSRNLQLLCETCNRKKGGNF